MSSPFHAGPGTGAERIDAICARLNLSLRIEAADVAWLTTELRASSDREAALRAEIETLKTPDIIGYSDEIAYAEDGFDGMADYMTPNGPPKSVWANRSLGHDWYMARVVTSWTDEGDVDEDDLQIFRTLGEAEAAISASEATHPESHLLASSGEERKDG